MPLRVPPGRAGRPWLVRRLEIARGGADVLDEKRRALLRERARVEPLVGEARETWERAAREAAGWLDRAAVLAGARRLRLASPRDTSAVEVHVPWRTALGVLIPEQPELVLPRGSGLEDVGGSAALSVAVAAHRRALEAAARYGAVQAASVRIAAELAATTRRLRAIERRWIPRHERALAALELALDESEREDAARSRWARRGERGARPAGPPA